MFSKSLAVRLGDKEKRPIPNSDHSATGTNNFYDVLGQSNEGHRDGLGIQMEEQESAQGILMQNCHLENQEVDYIEMKLRKI